MTIHTIIVDVVVDSTPALVRLGKYSRHFDNIVHLAPTSPFIVIVVVTSSPALVRQCVSSIHHQVLLNIRPKVFLLSGAAMFKLSPSSSLETYNTAATPTTSSIFCHCCQLLFFPCQTKCQPHLPAHPP
jgi:hypothetical protein